MPEMHKSQAVDVPDLNAGFLAYLTMQRVQQRFSSFQPAARQDSRSIPITHQQDAVIVEYE